MRCSRASKTSKFKKRHLIPCTHDDPLPVALVTETHFIFPAVFRRVDDPDLEQEGEVGEQRLGDALGPEVEDLVLGAREVGALVEAPHVVGAGIGLDVHK